MNDMRAVIVPKSDQLNSDDLIAGPITIKVASVTIRGGQEQPVSIHFDGDDGKPYKPCKSMSRVLVAAWGPDANQYVGRSLTLYRDPTVKWAGMEVGGIRISHMTDIDSAMTMALTATKGSRKPFTVKPLTATGDRVLDGTRDLISRIRAAGSAEAVEAITAEKTARQQRAYLAKNRPELAAEVDAAIAAASPAPQDDDPFAPPTPIQPAGNSGAPENPSLSDEPAAGSDNHQPEGRGDEDMGEAFTTVDAEADIIAHIAKKTRVLDVQGIVNSRAHELDEEGLDRVRVAATDKIAEIRAKEVAPAK